MITSQKKNNNFSSDEFFIKKYLKYLGRLRLDVDLSHQKREIKIDSLNRYLKIARDNPLKYFLKNVSKHHYKLFIVENCMIKFPKT